MKKRQLSILVMLTLVFSSFLLGFFLGRNTGHSPVTVSVPSAPRETAPAVTAAEDLYYDLEQAPETELRIVDLNTATLEQLVALPGIGEVTAQKILDYREANGPFRSPQELLNIKGIGQGKLEDLWDHVIAGGNEQ